MDIGLQAHEDVAEDNKSVVIDKTGEPDSTFPDFVKQLPSNEPRYCIFDYHHEFQDGRKTDKLVYIFWCPDDSKVQKKMVAATNNTNFQGKLQGYSFAIQCNDLDELNEAEIIKKIEH